MKILGGIFTFIGTVGLIIILVYMNTESYKLAKGLTSIFSPLGRDVQTLENTYLFILIGTLLLGIVLLIVGKNPNNSYSNCQTSTFEGKIPVNSHVVDKNRKTI